MARGAAGSGEAVAVRGQVPPLPALLRPPLATIWKAGSDAVRASRAAGRRRKGIIALRRSRMDVRRTGDCTIAGAERPAAARRPSVAGAEEEGAIPGSFSIWLSDGVRARAPADARDDGRDMALAERGGSAEGVAHDDGPAVSIPTCCDASGSRMRAHILGTHPRDARDATLCSWPASNVHPDAGASAATLAPATVPA
jgi:hypothetical protein